MLRIFVAALVLASFVGGASAQGTTNCATDFKAFWDRINQGGSAKMTGEQLANMHRMALRGYDACTAGDEQWSKQLWERLERGAGSAK